MGIVVQNHIERIKLLKVPGRYSRKDGYHFNVGVIFNLQMRKSDPKEIK